MHRYMESIIQPHMINWKLDLTYIENYSVWMDIKILFLTFKILFQKENTEGVDQNQTTAIK